MSSYNVVIEDILEIHQINRIREELDSLTKEFKECTVQSHKRILINRMRDLIGSLERHEKAVRKSMLIPLK